MMSSKHPSAAGAAAAPVVPSFTQELIALADKVGMTTDMREFLIANDFLEPQDIVLIGMDEDKVIDAIGVALPSDGSVQWDLKSKKNLKKLCVFSVRVLHRRWLRPRVPRVLLRRITMR